MNGSQMQFMVPKVGVVLKTILGLSVALFLLDLILGASTGQSLAFMFGLVPARLLEGWIWQPFTYVFLHAGVFHILFNLLILWSLGGELETLWGPKVFLAFFFVCGVGAAVFHTVFSIIGIGASLGSPVVGSSGVVYGLLLAYGILYGERTMYFFMLFPMPAKYFVAILGAVELVSFVFFQKDGIAHTAHLGGMVFGFFFLAAMASWRKTAKNQESENKDAKERQKRIKKGSHLKLVQEDDDDKPTHWN